MAEKPKMPKRKFVEYDSSEDEDIENGRPGTSSQKSKKMKKVKMDRQPSIPKQKFVENNSSDDDEDIENGRLGTSSQKSKKMNNEAKLNKSMPTKRMVRRNYEEDKDSGDSDWKDDEEDDDYLEPEDEWKENDWKRTKSKKMVRRDEEDSDDDWVNRPTTSTRQLVEKDSSEEDDIDHRRPGTSSQQRKTKKKRAKKMSVVIEDEDSDDYDWEDDEKDGDWLKHVSKRKIVCPERNCEIKLGHPFDLRKHLKRVHFSKLSGKELEQQLRAAYEGWMKARQLVAEKVNGIRKIPKKTNCCEVLDLPYNVSNLYCNGSEECRIRPKERYFGLRRKGPEGKEREYWCCDCFEDAKKDEIVNVEQFVSMQNKTKKSEDLLECNECKGVWHRCCTTHLGIRDEFWCGSCRKEDKPRIEMKHVEKGASFMEQRLNERIREEFRHTQKIKIVCFTSEKSVSTRSLVPNHLGNEFVAKYGEKISYRSRAIYAFQHQDHGDMVFLMMQTQEYIQPIRGDSRSFFVIQILDSVDYLQGVNRRFVYHQLLLSYFDYMKSVGILHGHFHADPPLKGDDYIFHVHPESQAYLDKGDLEGWYRKMMDQGKTERIIQEYTDFKKAMPGKIEPVRDLPLFDGELWSKAMLASEQEKNFEREMKKQYGIHATDNFFIQLKTPKGKIGQLDNRLFRNTILEDCYQFWRHMSMKNAEFVDRRRAIHSSLRVVKLTEKTRIFKVREDRGRKRQVSIPPITPTSSKMGKSNRYYNCPSCTRGGFIDSKKLRAHRRYAHANIQTHQCGICYKKFPNVKKLDDHQKKEHSNSQHEYEIAPPTPAPEAPGPSIAEDGDQNVDPMDYDDPDVPGPEPATLQMRMQNLLREDSLEKENPNLPGPGPDTREMRRLLNHQVAAAQVEDVEMEDDVEEGARRDEEVAAPEENVACCSRPLQARFNVPNRECGGESKCKNEARISPNSDYMGLLKPSRNGKEYCMDCFAENPQIQKKLYMKKTHQHEKFEEVLKCIGCLKLWHRCCSLFMGRSTGFECKECMKLDASKVLDAQKGRSRLVTMMEEKFNAILREKLGSKEAERSRISVRALVSRPKKQSTKSFASKHCSDVFEQKYGQEICFKTRTIAVFQRQDGVDQVFFMMFVREYQNLADQKSWCVIDYLDSVKYVQANLRRKIYPEILLSYFDFARSLGILHGYIWAKPPVKGDDFIFNIHSEDQQYLELDKLINWYRGILDKGVEMQRIQKYEDFGEKKIKKIKDLPLFIDSLWTKKMKEVEEIPNTTKKLFEQDMDHHMKKDHQRDNFFIELVQGCDLEDDDTPTTSQAWILDSLMFREHCRKSNWEFGSRERARFASVAIIKKLEENL
ncbi:hypothetical protein B9Z55_008133 [Caenorhabditis nigoni]|uniref:histone acetyltransferase n=2 Tax=Caenorhabditis nigoni TaxID=1611254 RepID=A0A2G5VCV0_9PELO|nr:hypothetical protein B9Z55_008133 [Caenorhabditis nigoni]